MALPNPLPDNPLRWDGWKNYNSENYYERLCIDQTSNASNEQIEENCRQLLVWWQKKLPLKNQPSNPLAQLLRGGLDEAPVYLVEARTELLNPQSRAKLDAWLQERFVEQAVEEFKKIISFALVDKKLAQDAEQRLHEAGGAIGLSQEQIAASIEAELVRVGGQREEAAAAAAPAAPSAKGAHRMDAASSDPSEEFRRMLRFSKLCLDGEEMTDDQRDALCNMGESLGLTGGQAEDLIDEYLEQVSAMPATVAIAPPVRVAPQPLAASAVAAAPVRTAPAVALPKEPLVNTSPLARAQERQKHPTFINSVGAEMFLVTSGTFEMGSNRPDATPLEQPVSRVTISCFYMARLPVTNEQFEKFDPSHRAKRAPWADQRHPVVYVSSKDAEAFCKWLSAKESRKYRLPTEAEWEYAARGLDGRTFPWGEMFNAGHYANFADKRTSFAWRDPNMDDGYAESSPVGSHPRGASPFGIEDMAGNVFEWCLDFFGEYRGKDRVNPRGSASGSKRVYRGGSWKSRASSLRTTARNSNLPEYSSNDVGFRIVCECG